ncbi:MAG: bifunctional diaminohydroxyphosphoribosylaminopyrimidine deaminase/5-amino-6-(5-phosphoribosylamino)uracil reductase RibD [Lachnospiraceae bacterium]|nr:bifunctional diaminohydroxyphosphoribosylaminopyrimidine deaminase/5-amino-6-(5-phosphoribosylamino)uracil reductase RibD [Lachnospiraceae bacterium]
MSFEKEYMERAIELAKKGIGAVNPNPLVGAVIVKDGRIIGEGYHAKYGELHAERNAFANLTEDATGAEMYVTLEPCCHYGKQPPCVEAIVEHKIAKVYVGSDDPNEKVAGKGIKYLRDNGIEVETQVMKNECDEINPVFFHYITTGKPYVVMKYAMTMDGKIATYKGLSKWITGEEARNRVQHTRHQYKGIMVGIGTVIEDNPMLTCRLEGGRNPIRIVCDSNLSIPMDCNLVKTAKNIPTIVGAIEKQPTDEEYEKYLSKLQALEKEGVQVISVKAVDNHIDLEDFMLKLGKQSIDGILLEGGGTLNYSALSSGIVNEVQMYIAPKIFGGKDAISPVEGIGVEAPDMCFGFDLKKVEKIDEDILLTYVKKECE